MKCKRKRHSAQFKAKIGLDALKGLKTIQEIAKEHGILSTTAERGLKNDGLKRGVGFGRKKTGSWGLPVAWIGVERGCGVG